VINAPVIPKVKAVSKSMIDTIVPVYANPENKCVKLVLSGGLVLAKPHQLTVKLVTASTILAMDTSTTTYQK
jgi:hypothetical protein